MTVKTKILFIIIISIAVIAVAVILIVENLAGYTLPTRGGVAANIQVAVAPSLEPWVREAATQFHQDHPQITVEIISLGGLRADQRLSLRDEESLIDAWIAEAGFVREMANNVPFANSGQSVAKTRLVWLAKDEYAGLQGNLDWNTAHDMAVDAGQWRSLSGGDRFLDAALPSPSNSVQGLAAYISAAASFQNRADLRNASVTDQTFLDWMHEIFEAVGEKNRAPVEQFARPPVSVDIGLLLESDLGRLNAGQFIQQFPRYNVVFDYPYIIRQDDAVENAVDQTSAAQQFGVFLLSRTQQERLAGFGFATASADLGQGVQIDGTTAETLWNRIR